MATELNSKVRAGVVSLALLCVCTVSCSGNDMGANANIAHMGTGGTGQSSPNPQAISFVPSKTVQLQPGFTAIRSVIVQPPGSYDVGLALLGASNDAALNSTSIRTGPDGRGQFSVTAASIATSFAVRASVGPISKELDVSVSLLGFASVKVAGNYAGNRSVTQWVATVKTGWSCTDFGSTLPEDGILRAESNSSPQMVVTSVPVDAIQSLILRGDSSVWGCKDIPTLVADGVLDLPVQVYDIPLVYGTEPVPANFAIATNAAAWASNLTTISSKLKEAVLQSTGDDTALLLDAMRAAASSTQLQADFDQRRSSGNWPSILVTQWSTLSGGSNGCISYALNAWLGSALEQIAAGITINTALTLTSTSSSMGQEQLNLKTIAGVSTGELQSATAFPLQTSFSANDGLAASAALTFNEAYLLMALAQRWSAQQLSTSTNIPNALSTLVDCISLAKSLDQSAPSNASCDASCLAQLCNDGLNQLWLRTDSVAKQWGTAQLTLSSSGNLSVSSNAKATGYRGTWVGLISSPSGNVSSGGNIN